MQFSCSILWVSNVLSGPPGMRFYSNVCSIFEHFRGNRICDFIVMFARDMIVFKAVRNDNFKIVFARDLRYYGAGCKARFKIDHLSILKEEMREKAAKSEGTGASLLSKSIICRF